MPGSFEPAIVRYAPYPWQLLAKKRSLWRPEQRMNLVTKAPQRTGHAGRRE